MAKKDKEQEERAAQKEAQSEERLARERDRQKELQEERARRNAERRDRQVIDPTTANTPLVPSASLASLVGARRLSYRDARRKVSAYIRYNRLQKYPRDKSCVTLDAKLASLLGKKPGAELDMQAIAQWTKAEMRTDPVADAQRQILQESLRERAVELQKNTAREQEERVSDAEKLRKKREDERRDAAEAHRQRVEEEYRRLKEG